MLLEEDILAMAQAYRDMAGKAHDPKLKLEFTERAERYEFVAWVVQRRSTSDAG